jgi:cytochrome c
MCTREILVAAGLFCLFGAGGCAQEAPSLGAPVDVEALAGLDFTVMPDGEGLPEGRGDAVAGAEVYRQQCLACHGESGTGGANDELVGGQGSLATANPKKTIGSYWPYAPTLFDYIRRAMPYPAPGTLSNDELYAITAYLLYLNDIIDRDTVIDKDSLPAVAMPNRNGFDRAYPSED